MPSISAPAWSLNDIQSLDYQRFRKLFIAEGLNTHGRRGQVQKIAAMARGGAQAKLVGQSISERWESGK